MAERTCSVDGCERPLLARGMCVAHYGRWKKGTDLSRPIEPRGKTLDDKLWSRFDKVPSGCWLWQGSLRCGYGQFRWEGKLYSVHRFVYECLVGPIPDGMKLDHECHNRDLSCKAGKQCIHRRCANPAHLSVVTHAENCRSSGRCGQPTHDAQRAKTHCPQGHPYAGDNLYVVPKTGSRHCRTCMTESSRRYEASHPERAGQVRRRR